MTSASFALSRRAARVIGTLALAALITACDDDDPIAASDEPNTSSVLLIVSGGGSAEQTITWNTENGTVTPPTITVPAGATRTVMARFLQADGTVDPIVTSEGFRLDFNVTNGAAATITKNGNLAATITAGANPGTVSMTLDLEHLGDGHTEYGPSNTLTVTVQ